MRRTRQDSGGILIVVLMIILVGSAITTGWIMTMTSEIEYVEQFAASAKRRIATANADALVRQHILAYVLTRDGSTGSNADIGNGWGSVNIPNSAGIPLLSFSQSAGFNHFNPGNGGGYAFDPYNLNVTMNASGNSFTRRYLIRSRSSVLGGTMMALHTPGAAASGSLIVQGQTQLWVPANSFSMFSASFAVPSAPGGELKGLGGDGIPASNFPFIPLTGSNNASGVASYNGLLNVIANGSGINSMSVMSSTSAPNGRQNVNGQTPTDANGVVSDGAGTITIDLIEPALGNVVIDGGMSRLILRGQTSEADRLSAGNAAAIMILVLQTSPATTLTEVEFQNTNYRKVVLAIKTPNGTGTSLRFTHAGSGPWRSVLTLENTPATITLTGGGSQSLVGGVQSDQAIAVQGGALQITPEPDPKLLDRLTARDGWIEAYTP